MARAKKIPPDVRCLYAEAVATHNDGYAQRAAIRQLERRGWYELANQARRIQERATKARQERR